MALKLSSKTPIPTPRTGNVSFGSGNPPKLIPQEASQWCWAACAEMAKDATNGIMLNQCILAVRYHGAVGCCQTISDSCNQPVSAQTISQIFIDESISFNYSSSAISEPNLVNELSNDYLIEVGWHSPGHVALVVDSYKDPNGHNIFVIYDPLPVNVGTIHRVLYSGLNSLGPYSNWKSTWHSIT